MLLAGATGVIGRSLVPLLLNHGHHVAAMSRREASPAERRDRLRWRSVNVFDRAAVFALMEEERPDCVMHQLTDLTSMNSDENALLRSVGTRNLVDAAQAAGVRRMVAQSIAWGYEPGSEPADEGTPLDLHAPYPRQTTIRGVVALESAVAEIRHFVVLRYGTLYGPGTWYARDGAFARRVREQTMQQSSEVTNFLHVEDAANAALLALHWPNGVVNIVDGDSAMEAEWLPLYAKRLNAPEPPRSAANQEVSGMTRVVGNAHARSLGWQPSGPTWRGYLGLE